MLRELQEWKVTVEMGQFGLVRIPEVVRSLKGRGYIHCSHADGALGASASLELEKIRNGWQCPSQG